MRRTALLMLVLTVTVLGSCRRSDQAVPARDDVDATPVQPPPEPPGMQQPNYPDRGVDTLRGGTAPDTTAPAAPGTGTGTSTPGAPGTGTGAGTPAAPGTGTGAGTPAETGPGDATRGADLATGPR